MAKKDDQQTNVRLPAALKERITQAANEAGRSFTAELVRRLEASFESVLEATLLQARLAERGDLLAALQEGEQRLEDLSKELASYTGAVRKEDDSDMAAQLSARIAEIIKEQRMLEEQNLRIAKYLDRLREDVKVLGDDLQARMRWMDEMDF
ncbi:TPA: Arc family DNA-binding protein [Stenotrophomonas maltophilia]|uniref:Arc family DNA-binding protein n=1 Tax=Stenotrophomonas TaxID=40323 RepID=UPI0013DD1F3C|nr:MULTISPECIES: Arc family DNA-binding protein [Stenotrophomonas]MBH1605153.1 Arc family DNA-binding protein [Stenotrophomonas maltophilia]MDQ7290242.1 Arc family DNA-binding protein [Stenotrophomonas sp. Sm2128]MDT3471464.1 Arc family DNA-binding protein [Stenotrophomonas maltophilia]HDS1829812.1 Arc family DNA-binding protein [Stenotrophomonas maltophilia]HDX0787793.1 Arc family DNA-binding protein [Stenotrophomonas maltophilia]